MTLQTRWYVTGVADLSQSLLGDDGTGGKCSALYKHITAIPGQWIGSWILPGHNLSLSAVTYDSAIVSAQKIRSDFNALQAAPDDEVYDVRTPISGPASSWTRYQGLVPILSSRFLNTGLIKQTGSVREVLRKVGCQIHLLNYLQVPPQATSTTLSSLSSSKITSVEARIRARGWKPLSRSTSIANTISSLLSQKGAGFCIEEGWAKAGHPNAHLGKGGVVKAGGPVSGIRVRP